MYWSTYKNMDASQLQVRHRHVALTLIVDSALRGKQVICVDYHGRLETAWRTPVLLQGWRGQDAHFLVACGEGGKEEEEVILISCHRDGARLSELKFFKLDDAAMAWPPLDDAELDGFSVRGKCIRSARTSCGVTQRQST
ncbi:hypothetical protein E2562_011951 [Oryza meyeriana var. granulata]|uniref:Uncharacterized protein n=1 Tax=Oryza meyeriana var. granulata TaxID=110450 RepID=A0A6G1F6V1_9ORYZ|nr:hypothetical protein E2562_011951 [Oryza meyeriana var. granulata]